MTPTESKDLGEVLLSIVGPPWKATDSRRGSISTIRVRLMRLITVSREYSAGGGEVASQLASALGWYLLDRELLHRAAQLGHLPNPELQATRRTSRQFGRPIPTRQREKSQGTLAGAF